MSASRALMLPANVVPFAPASPAARPDAGWLSAEQIAARAGVTAIWIRRLARSGAVIFREVPARGRNGKNIREYLVESLPKNIQTKLLPAPPAQKQLPVPAPSPHPELMPLFRPEQPDRPRILLTPAQEKLAMERFEAIRPLDEFARGDGRQKFLALRLKDGRAVSRSRDLAAYISETLLVRGRRPSVTTLLRWLALYRAEGLHGLGRRTREDKGTCHFFSRYPAAAVLVAAEYHKPHATYWRAYNALERERGLLHVPADEMPGYTTVRNYLRSLPGPMKILAREGQAAYATRCAPHLSRKYTDIPANEIWVADHQIHDVEVRNDCMAGAEMDAPLRLQFTCIMDMRSRKIVGYCWTVNGDWRSIATALRRAVERFGPCEVFYCDNGNDFKKAARGAARVSRPCASELQPFIDGLVRGPLAELGTKVQHCIPYAPQSKPVERAFGTIHGGLDAIMPHYTTGNAYTRPDQTVIAGNEHRKLMRHGLGAFSGLMPASYFIKLAETWIERKYNAGHRHRGRGMDGQTPDQVFDAGYPMEMRRKADPDVLAMLLHERRTAYVRRTAVTIDGRRYMPAQSSPESWVAIHNANETSITVAYDPLDPDRVIALDERGRRMADLVVERLVEHPVDGEAHPGNDRQIGDMMRMRAKLLGAAAGTVKRMHRAVALAGHKTELEHLAELAMQTVPVDDLVSQRAIRQRTKASDTATAPASSFDIAAEILGYLA